MAGIDVFARLTLMMKYPRSRHLRSIFERLLTTEEADILLELPTPPQEIAGKLNLDQETVERRIEEMYQKGLVIPTSKGYFPPRAIAQFHDTVLTTPGVSSAVADLWQQFSEEDWFRPHADELAEAGDKRAKVYPMFKAIETSSDILPDEDVRRMVQQTELIAVAPCPCRIRGRQCDAPLDTCLQFNKAAEFTLRRGIGREISVEETIEILDDAEEYGLIHTAPNIPVLCNCCSCCCNIVRPLDKHGKLQQGLRKNSYRSVVSPQLCTGCRLCVDRCFFGAIEMKDDTVTVDTEKCFGCGSCVVSCPAEGALRLELAEKVAVS